jgi:hypothetical protein
MGPAAIVDELERIPVHAFGSLQRRGWLCDRARMKTPFRVIA